MYSARPVLTTLIAVSLAAGPAAPAWAAASHAAQTPAPKGERAVAVGGRQIEVKVGTTPTFSRIEFHGAQPVSARREGDDLVLRFGQVADPDLARLRVSPPRFLKTAEAKPVAGGLEIRLILADEAQAKLGKDENGAYVHLSAAPAPPPAAAARHDQTPPPARPNPIPVSGVVKMTPELKGRTLMLKFPWRAPLGVSVFRRGDAVWLVFDAPARLDLADAPRGMPQMGKMTAVQGKTFSAVRITAPQTTVASASAEGGIWTLALGPAALSPSAPVQLGREDATGSAVLTAQVAGTTGVFWIADPVVGDRIAAVTALPPAKGLIDRRAFVDATVLASTQGLAVQPVADDLEVSADGDLVRIGRPKGMKLSSASMASRQPSAPIGLPQPTSLPGLVDFAAWSKTGEGGFLARNAQIQQAAAEEAAKGKGGGSQARMALARFLIGSELAHEAIGVLNMVAQADERMLSDPELRGLRGAARVMAGRYQEAQADFSSPVLADDPASALWRGYAAARRGDHTGAREQLAAGHSALAQFAPKWRARFVAAEADAALALGDPGSARAVLMLAPSEGLDPDEIAALQLARARLMEAGGQTEQALGLYEAVAKSPYGAVSAPALLRATEIRLTRGQVETADAVRTLDSLRFRWRGDATELETVRALGRIYLSQGNYRDALDALRSAGRRLPDLPAAVGLQADLGSAFRDLFLNGGADGLQPIQALALFYDFREQTPIGAEGDLMVRRLARRLVDVDLLDQAAELLKYQAENRLDGVARAEVATDQAMINLMNRKAEQALIAINSSRTTLLPNALNAERRVIEARALMLLGRYDHALEVLGKDVTPEAAEVRGEAAWKQRDWPKAGALLEARLGERWKSPAPLSAEEETKLLRAGAAYSLANDEAALARLRTRYGKLTDGSRSPEAMQVALSGADLGALTAVDFTRAVSDVDAFAGWTARMKKKFREKPAPVAAAKPAAAPPKPAPAKPPTQAAQAKAPADHG
jgi:tetratricopeptide (TPR) repeat protein